MRDWMKVMLEEVERKQAERDEATDQPVSPSSGSAPASTPLEPSAETDSGPGTQ